MKFQKDNSGVVFTQKMKDDIIAKEEVKEEAKEEAKLFVAKQEEVGNKIKEIMKPVIDRIHKYGALTDQLDTLWHDIDEERIQADKTSANSWYMSIKTVKDENPILANWEEEIEVLYSNTVFSTGPTSSNV